MFGEGALPVTSGKGVTGQAGIDQSDIAADVFRGDDRQTREGAAVHADAREFGLTESVLIKDLDPDMIFEDQVIIIAVAYKRLPKLF